MNLPTQTQRRVDEHAVPHAERLAALARQALIAEADLTPKPGLVDRRGSGCHTDLTLCLMRRSALAIEPYFAQMALAASGKRPTPTLREQLVLIGRNAERAMLKSTGGSNAHKGAIWALGLLLSAASMRGEEASSASQIASTASELASFSPPAAPRLVSHGDISLLRYGAEGARGEAINGFPHIVRLAMPMLIKRRAEGIPERFARLDTLLSIMSHLTDTCLLYRGGRAALVAAQQGAREVLAKGGCGTTPGAQSLQRLDKDLLRRGVSPGGSADLLAATLWLDAVQHRRTEVLPDDSLAEASRGEN